MNTFAELKIYQIKNLLKIDEKASLEWKLTSEEREKLLAELKELENEKEQNESISTSGK
jgi:hypothetical protein